MHPSTVGLCVAMRVREPDGRMHREAREVGGGFRPVDPINELYVPVPDKRVDPVRINYLGEELWSFPVENQYLQGGLYGSRLLVRVGQLRSDRFRVAVSTPPRHARFCRPVEFDASSRFSSLWLASTGITMAELGATVRTEPGFPLEARLVVSEWTVRYVGTAWPKQQTGRAPTTIEVARKQIGSYALHPHELRKLTHPTGRQVAERVLRLAHAITSTPRG